MLGMLVGTCRALVRSVIPRMVAKLPPLNMPAPGPKHQLVVAALRVVTVMRNKNCMEVCKCSDN